ncbi:MAG: CDP-glycerol glycerophosphotransferase family protein, partial [Lachnospiraceae bacterium]|jgi:CDP-glycerol glycerophosphotransferase (TagB/SpsB family)|nr:CDP-glycerol glycerophosphotransferase family protein [Lachnospiraceae bacterium]
MKKMRGRLSKEYILLCKFHPLAREIDSFIDTSFAKDVTKTFDIDELISIADICISDYSSLIFEFSLMNKPMIFFQYDLEDYIDNRGFYYNYLDFVPGPIVKDTEELLEQISVIDENFDYERLKRFRDKFMISCDGNSTVRLIDYIENEL